MIITASPLDIVSQYWNRQRTFVPGGGGGSQKLVMEMIGYIDAFSQLAFNHWTPFKGALDKYDIHLYI